MKILFLINERSGVQRRFDIHKVISAACGRAAVEHELLRCERKEDLDAVVERGLRERFDVLYAVGGDGTVHEVAKRLIGRELALGILPIGSGNGLARHLGLPLQGERLDESLFHSGQTVDIDTAEVNGQPFIGVMGLGLDAEIAHRFAASGRRGLKTYVLEGLRAYFRYPLQHYELVVDGQSERLQCMVMAVANASQYGNNARIAPVASLRDGLLDVVAVRDVSLLSAPFLVFRLFNGTIHHSSRVHIARGREILIRREQEGPAHLDGEPVMLPAELRVRVLPNSLRVRLPVAPRTI